MFQVEEEEEVVDVFYGWPHVIVQMNRSICMYDLVSKSIERKIEYGCSILQMMVVNEKIILMFSQSLLIYKLSLDLNLVPNFIMLNDFSLISHHSPIIQYYSPLKLLLFLQTHNLINTLNLNTYTIQSQYITTHTITTLFNLNTNIYFLTNHHKLSKLILN